MCLLDDGDGGGASTSFRWCDQVRRRRRGVADGGEPTIIKYATCVVLRPVEVEPCAGSYGHFNASSAEHGAVGRRPSMDDGPRMHRDDRRTAVTKLPYTILLHALLLSVNAFTVARGVAGGSVMPYRTAGSSSSLSADNQQPLADAKWREAEHQQRRRCVPITIPLCQRIGYNMTSYPNSLGHDNQDEAGLEVHQFYPLVEVNCYRHLKFFLCAMYTPICQDNYELTVLPCREVCTEARRNCAPLMQQYGFRWPATLECDERLPKMSEQQTTGNICAAPPDVSAADEAGALLSLSLPTLPPLSGNLGGRKSDDNAERSSSDTVVVESPPNLEFKPPPLIGIAVSGGRATVGQTRCSCDCSRHASFVKTTMHLRRISAVQNISGCAYACHSDAVQSTADRAFLDAWLGVWASICLALSAFTVLTFLTDVGRFPYPERPIFFLSLCQMLVAVGFVLRVWRGHSAIVCGEEAGGDEAALGLSVTAAATPLNQWIGFSTFYTALSGDPFAAAAASASHWWCAAVFLLTYYFGMCASAWWVVLSLSWVLAAVPHWSTEWIAKYSAYFHLFAWLTPAAQTVAVLARDAVDGDPVLGVCYVGATDLFNLRAFVLGPLVLYFLVGVGFLFIGFLNLWAIRTNLKKTHPGVDKTSKLTQLMSKIGVFTVLYTVPAIFLILALFYEQHNRDVWERQQLCGAACVGGEALLTAGGDPLADDGITLSATQLLLALIKSASALAVGWTSGVWILSAKTLASWRRFLGRAAACGAHKAARSRRRQGYRLATDEPIRHNHNHLHHHAPHQHHHHSHRRGTTTTSGGIANPQQQQHQQHGNHPSLLHDDMTPIHQSYHHGSVVNIVPYPTGDGMDTVNNNNNNSNNNNQQQQNYHNNNNNNSMHHSLHHHLQQQRYSNANNNLLYSSTNNNNGGSIVGPSPFHRGGAGGSGGRGENCMSPMTYATTSGGGGGGTLRHCVPAVIQSANNC